MLHDTCAPGRMPKNAKKGKSKKFTAATDQTDDDFGNMLVELRAEDLATATSRRPCYCNKERTPEWRCVF
jgi:hypothetical protein